jgi:2'-5' RNA ligase
VAEPVRRLFFALWPPAAVARRLHDEALSLQRACGGRAMRRETLHLTLAFLGAIPVSRVAAAEAAADAVSAGRFTLELDRLACWKHNRIAWAGCTRTPEALAGLAGDLARNLCTAGFKLDARPFAVHATLVRNADCAASLPALPSPLVWPVEDFALVESHTGPGGSRYEVVRRWGMH